MQWHHSLKLEEEVREIWRDKKDLSLVPEGVEGDMESVRKK